MSWELRLNLWAIQALLSLIAILLFLIATQLGYRVPT
jgi:hypothetical protein